MAFSLLALQCFSAILLLALMGRMSEGFNFPFAIGKGDPNAERLPDPDKPDKSYGNPLLPLNGMTANGLPMRLLCVEYSACKAQLIRLLERKLIHSKRENIDNYNM